MDAFSKKGKLTVLTVPGWPTTDVPADLATVHGGAYRSPGTGPERVYEGVVGDSIRTIGGALTWAEQHEGVRTLQGIALGRWASYTWTPDPAEKE